MSGDNASNSLTTFPACGTTYTPASPVGTYTTSCSGASAPNYAITYAGGVFNVVFAWGGFLQPINDTAHQTGVSESKFKLGQTIPVKFELTQCGRHDRATDAEPDLHEVRQPGYL